ncbi:hypothetical protein PIB30_098342 [Stylosanthes scabra]|uniref:Uncharacterized protein n=1 Tax=Stylosanthes scabra TaxID=79078 RepID=A0ABU6UW69_9FABA|nr:hypothetical protein [Stylosanthes scabra]
MHASTFPTTPKTTPVKPRRGQQLFLSTHRRRSPRICMEHHSSAPEHGSRRDKPTIEFDPEIGKTLKKNQSRVKAQRTLQFNQEEINSEEGGSEKSFEEELVEENIEEEIQDNMADNANN